MYILFAIIGILAGFTAWYWRLQLLDHGAREAAEASTTATNPRRRLSFYQKSKEVSLELVEDPRDAATLIMIEIARANDTLTTTEEELIRCKLLEIMGMNEAEVEETYVHAAWLAKNLSSPEHVTRRMSDIIIQNDAIGQAELTALDQSLVAVATVDGPASENQARLIDLFRECTGLV